MAKYFRDYSRNRLVINLLGDDDHVERATKDIISILDKKNISHKVVSLHPTTLARQPNNEMPKWRFQIHEEMRTDKNVIINKIGHVNCDEITDLNRSIRALSSTRHPIALYVEPDTNRRNAHCLSFTKNSSYDFLNKCSQVTSIFPLNTTDEIKMYEFEIYLDSHIVEIKE